MTGQASVHPGTAKSEILIGERLLLAKATCPINVAGTKVTEGLGYTLPALSRRVQCRCRNSDGLPQKLVHGLVGLAWVALPP